MSPVTEELTFHDPNVANTELTISPDGENVNITYKYGSSSNIMTGSGNNVAGTIITMSRAEYNGINRTFIYEAYTDGTFKSWSDLPGIFIAITEGLFKPTFEYPELVRSQSRNNSFVMIINGVEYPLLCDDTTSRAYYLSLKELTGWVSQAWGSITGTVFENYISLNLGGGNLGGELNNYIMIEHYNMTWQVWTDHA